MLDNFTEVCNLVNKKNPGNSDLTQLESLLQKCTQEQRSKLADYTIGGGSAGNILKDAVYSPYHPSIISILIKNIPELKEKNCIEPILTAPHTNTNTITAEKLKLLETLNRPLTSNNHPTIFIAEEHYGFRHSTRAAAFRRHWRESDEKRENAQSSLNTYRNIATIKLIPNPAKNEIENLSPVYVTLSNIQREEINDDVPYTKRKVSAHTHSEQVGFVALAKGYKVPIRGDHNTMYNQITNNGQYLIAWVYTEREPCKSNYKNHCSAFIQDLAVDQFNNHQVPIEVFYSNPYYKTTTARTTHAQLQSSSIEITHVNNSAGYPLSKKSDEHNKQANLDLYQDVALGKTIITSSETANIQEDDFNDATAKAVKEFNPKQIEEAIIEIEKSIQSLKTACLECGIEPFDSLIYDLKVHLKLTSYNPMNIPKPIKEYPEQHLDYFGEINVIIQAYNIQHNTSYTFADFTKQDPVKKAEGGKDNKQKDFDDICGLINAYNFITDYTDRINSLNQELAQLQNANILPEKLKAREESIQTIQTLKAIEKEMKECIKELSITDGNILNFYQDCRSLINGKIGYYKKEIFLSEENKEIPEDPDFVDACNKKLEELKKRIHKLKEEHTERKSISTASTPTINTTTMNTTITPSTMTFFAHKTGSTRSNNLRTGNNCFPNRYNNNDGNPTMWNASAIPTIRATKSNTFTNSTATSTATTTNTATASPPTTTITSTKTNNLNHPSKKEPEEERKGEKRPPPETSTEDENNNPGKRRKIGKP